MTNKELATIAFLQATLMQTGPKSEWGAAVAAGDALEQFEKAKANIANQIAGVGDPIPSAYTERVKDAQRFLDAVSEE